MKEKIRMLFAAAAASCLFLLLFLKLKWNLIFCIVLSVGIYFGLYFLLKPRRKMAGIAGRRRNRSPYGGSQS